MYLARNGVIVGHYADHDFTAHDSAQRLRSTPFAWGYIWHRCVTIGEGRVEQGRVCR